MPMFYVDDKRRKGAPFLVHQHGCLFRSKDALLLGEFTWTSRAIRTAEASERNVGRCSLCCPLPPINRKKRQSKFQRLAEKLRRQYRTHS